MAVSFSGMPATSSIYAAYASVSTFIMLLQTMFNQLVPLQLQNYALKKLQHLFKRRRSCATIVVEEKEGISSNEVYSAAETYLCAKIRPNFDRLKISKLYKDDNMRVKFAQCEKIVDRFEEIDLEWVFVSEENSNKAAKVFDESTDDFVFSESEKRYFELQFDSKHKDRVLDSYLPFVMESADTIRDEKRTIKLHTLASSSSYTSLYGWESINLDHPSTFETLAMEPSQKAAIVQDLDRFVRRKDFYRKVGKAWKRGYLLYGPPGTGKSSLIAAMANYLKFDVYDLELTNIKRDSDLRKLLLKTENRSILVIEDIDCTVALPGRKGSSGGSNSNRHSLHNDQFSLSGLLNFIDGLWSSCGDERIIVFTTNNKDKLDPALLRPGRMDMHIHMSYLTPEAFKLLAATYLAIDFHHDQRLSEIEDLIRVLKVTPAEIAEELMKSDDIDTSLDGVLDFLQCKSNNDVVINDNEVDDEGVISACAKCAKRRMKRRSASGKSCGDGNNVISSM